MDRRTVLQGAGSGLALSVLPGAGVAYAARTGHAARSAPSLVPGSPPAPSPAPSVVLPERGAINLNAGWRFHPGDIEAPATKTFQDSYLSAKAGGARGAAAVGFDDTAWRLLDLPHDWAIESPLSSDENGTLGYRHRGFGWYRRSLVFDPALAGRYLELQFGAIATNATIWFNGTPVVHNWSGYNSMAIDVTALANFGAPNTLAVRVDAQAAEAWAYEGAGIYRDVWLIDRPPIGLVTDGVHADPRRGEDGIWHIPVEATVYSIGNAVGMVDVVAELLGPDGHIVASARGALHAAPLERTALGLMLDKIQPDLWSPDRPVLYTVRTRLVVDGRITDERVTPCGFRTIRFDPAHGLLLNSQPLKIKGVCLRQDHAGTGVAIPAALVDWRLRQLKAMGCNAIRVAHGAPDRAVLDACDRLGLLVMDENRNFNTSPDYLAQLEWLVRRDRNHPCVFLWSIFNEEPIQNSVQGYEMARRSTALVKSLDDSRPVTAAMSSVTNSKASVAQAVDVVGFNYQNAGYDRFHSSYPDKPILSSEDCSAFMTRGAVKSDKAAHVASGDDSEHAAWGLSHRAAWKAIDTRPFVAGGFCWTGFDYHGEPTPYAWPSNSSLFGILDLCGFPKAAFSIRRALWRKDVPVLDILPQWNRAGDEGKPLKVLIATNLDRVQLRLGGRVVGDGKPDPYDMITFDVPYAPGRLEAIGWKDGAQVARSVVETTGPATALRLILDRPGLLGDGFDAQPVRIEAVDARGRMVPTANIAVTLTIGNGRLIGVGNGDPTSLAPSKGNRVETFNGLAQTIVQTIAGTSGKMLLSASAPGLAGAGVAMAITPAQVARSLPPLLSQVVRLWRQSPVMPIRASLIQGIADSDMNSWAPVIAGEPPQPATGAGYVMVLAKAVLTEPMRRRGTVLRFQAIQGAGDVLVDGRVAATKPDAAAAPLSVALPPHDGDIVIALVLHVKAGEAVGLAGQVVLEAAGLS
ncbi:beta-galactosidase GalA [Novosphingobium sp.]|uniref:beta-galactosidase GalA n=1 Tax=Novosphingobium sp. TaxID=1874826 RepID=UPI003D0E5DB8